MRFADLPIRRKLLAMALVITAIVLLASCAVLVAFDLVSLRRELRREFGTLSDVIAANCSAALAFGAAEDATELLHTLGAERSVLTAALYDRSGSLFASFTSAGAVPPNLPPAPPEGQSFRQGRLVTHRPVIQNGRELGTLVLETDLRWWYQRLWVYASVALGVVGMAFLASTVFSTFIRKSITRPVDELARVAKKVSEHGDFLVRAQKYGSDELGALTDTFNQMLAQLQERETALRESEAQRLVALEAAGLGTWIYDAKTDTALRDGSLNRLMGLGVQPTRSGWSELLAGVAPEDRDRIREAMESCLKSGADLEAEYRVLRPDGTVRWVRDRGRRLPSTEGDGAKLAGAVMDITERKASEDEILRLNAGLERRVAQRTAELEDSNRNLEAFAYSVSHDLRAPLRIISGYAEVLLEDRGKELPEDHKMCLTRIVDGARRMNRLIDDLLHFSRVGQQPLKVQPTPMDRLVDEVLGDLAAETKDRAIEWKRAVLPTVDCDPSLMRQVWLNLLSNALKYSRPRNPAVIEISWESDNDFYLIRVRDNGVGFDSASATRLFGVFQRMHGSQEFEGNGVGLATASRIVRRHGGRIWADSKVGEGATFSFTVPKTSSS